MKNRSEFKHGFTNRRFLCDAILKALHGFQQKRDMQCFLQNFQNDFLQNDFKIFRMFKNNMKFTRAACWINSKISNIDKSITLTTFLCHYCWSFFWCNYWKSLKSGTQLPNSFICFNESPLKVMENAFYFTLKTPLVLKIFKFFCWHFGPVKNQLD